MRQPHADHFAQELLWTPSAPFVLHHQVLGQTEFLKARRLRGKKALSAVNLLAREVQQPMATLLVALQAGILPPAEQAALEQSEELEDSLGSLNCVVRNLRLPTQG